MNNKMSPNQSGTTHPEQQATQQTGHHHQSVVLGTENGGGFDNQIHIGDDDPHLTTDCPCPSYMDVIKNRPFVAPVRKEDNEGSDASTPSQKITIESIKGASDDDFEDDRSSVVTESSCSDSEDHVEGTFHKGLKKTADTLALDAINCASDELQTSGNREIRVQSELGALTKGSANGGVNNGYVKSELVALSRERNASDKELVASGQNGQLAVPGGSVVAPQTTAIFNDSTDITLGNKTYITGSLTIKQYIKDVPKAKQSFWEKLSRRKRIAFVGAVAAAVVALITLTVLLTDISTNENDLASSGSVLRMVSRGEWVAQPPNDEIARLVLPIKRVIIAHTATENCTTQSSCVFRVRYIQNFHIESQNFSDIGYNFLVGGDGAVYEGRGWDLQGAHTRGYNVGSVCIAFIGTFTKREPLNRQLNVAKLLIEEGVRLKKLDKDYKLYGHRQFFGTESPGEKLYNIIKQWPHWANDVD